MAEDPNWPGYLIPSDEGEDPYLTSDQARRQFKKLCRKANVRIDGELGTPQNGRAFAYNQWGKAETELLERAGKIAEKLGSVDAATVRDDYLTREVRRDFLHSYFKSRMKKSSRGTHILQTLNLYMPVPNLVNFRHLTHRRTQIQKIHEFTF